MSGTNQRGQKRHFVEISSFSEEESFDDDDDDYIEITSSNSSEDEDDESEWNDLDDECSSDNNYGVDNLDHLDDESVRSKVFHLLQEKSDLLDLNLKECKAYLRKNGLRLSGTKLECIKRIEEHWRLKDGNGEAIYPRSSFTIDCTGDVCKGDVVLFTQKVYKKFDKVSRSGDILGTRTIAGRIVKESYGAAKQQHTFTVEVLWSKGVKKLPPLFPLLVKGRNLYRLKTSRQRWENEEERLKVLAEKHQRGATARSVRAMRKMEAAKGINAEACRKKGITKLQKHSCQLRQNQKTKYEKENCVNRKAPAGKRTSLHCHKKPHPIIHHNSNETREPTVSRSYGHQIRIHTNNLRESPFQSYPFAPNYYQIPSEIRPSRAPNCFSPIPDSAHFNSYPVPFGMPGEHQEFNRVSYHHRAPSHFTFRSQSRYFNHFPN